MGEHDLFDAPSEEPVDLRRYLEALRRRARLIAGLSVGIALLVLIFSESLPKTYTATAQIAPSSSALSSGSGLGSGGASGSTSAAQNLATVQAYKTSPAVLSAAARLLHTTSDTLQRQITTSVEPNANIVDVSATSSGPRRAANIATTTAQSFLSIRAASEQAQLAQQASALTARATAAQASRATGLASALEQQISSIAALEASAGSDLQLLSPAAGGATSPRPFQNALFALIAVLFLSALAVAGKEMIAPSLSGGRELSAATGLLTRLPHSDLVNMGLLHRRVRNIDRRPNWPDHLASALGEEPGRSRTAGALSSLPPAIYEPPRELVLELEQPPLESSPTPVAKRGGGPDRGRDGRYRSRTPRGEERTVMVASASAGDDKTSVAIGLALTAAAGGKEVALIECDLRHATIASRLKLQGCSCVSEILLRTRACEI